jgi:molybdate transport system substrate-binding protein
MVPAQQYFITCNPGRQSALYWRNDMRIKALAIGSIILIAQGLAAEAADVKLIIATPMAGAVKEIGTQYERDTGHKLVTKILSGPGVKREIDAGETFDLAVSITPVIDALIKEGRLVAGTRADVAYGSLGLGVRAGAPKPDISSVGAFKRTLLNAKSVVYSAEGAGGTYFRGLLERLGIADEVKTKLKPMTEENYARAMRNGEAEMIVGAASNVMEFGADLVGPLPVELQNYIQFTAGVSVSARETEAAKALIKLLTAPAAIAVIKGKGLEPGTAR